jgi:hypothetical protein
MKNINGNNACGKTDQTSEQDEPPVVLTSKAGKYAEHGFWHTSCFSEG